MNINEIPKHHLNTLTTWRGRHASDHATSLVKQQGIQAFKQHNTSECIVEVELSN